MLALSGCAGAGLSSYPARGCRRASLGALAFRGCAAPADGMKPRPRGSPRYARPTPSEGLRSHSFLARRRFHRRTLHPTLACGSADGGWPTVSATGLRPHDLPPRWGAAAPPVRSSPRSRLPQPRTTVREGCAPASRLPASGLRPDTPQGAGRPPYPRQRQPPALAPADRRAAPCPSHRTATTAARRRGPRSPLGDWRGPSPAGAQPSG